MKARVTVHIFLILAAILANSSTADAFVIDLNTFYYSDTFKVSTTDTQSRIFGDLGIGLDVDKKGQWVLGWNVGYVSATDQSTTTDTYTVTEMGPKVGYFLDKERFYGLWVTYNLVVNGSYQSAGGATETWRGTSIKVELGITPAITSEMYAGIKLIYHSETFTESLIGTTNYTVVTYARSFIYPSLNFSMRY